MIRFTQSERTIFSAETLSRNGDKDPIKLYRLIYELNLTIEFSLNVFADFKIFVITVKGFESDTSCVREEDATTVPARHVTDRIFKLTPIHASVIY